MPRRVSRAALARREEELAALSARLMSVQEEERRRISRELHDELGQSLTAVSAFFWLLEQKLPPDLRELRSQVVDTRLASQTLAQMRELSQLLRLETALFRIAQEALTNVARHARASHVDVSLTRDADGLRLEVRLEVRLPLRDTVTRRPAE